MESFKPEQNPKSTLCNDIGIKIDALISQLK